MIKNKMALLGAVATLGMLGGGFVSPAQAIVYNVSARLADGGFVTGSFDYSSNTYSDWSINVLSVSATGLSAPYTAILNLALGKGCRKKDNGKGEQN